jgi:hypothetical protein
MLNIKNQKILKRKKEQKMHKNRNKMKEKTLKIK